jgi:hypothetical protein
MKPFLLLAFAICLVASCKEKNSGNTGNDKKVMASEGKKTSDKQKASSKSEESTNSKSIQNDIQVQSTGGVKVKGAYLTLRDGTPVEYGNEVKINEACVIHLDISGWNVKDGRTYIGASERIFTNSGDKVLDQPDLLSSYDDTGINAAEPALTLMAKITRLDKQYDYFTVSFRVWDKKGNGEVTGSYKLVVK